MKNRILVVIFLVTMVSWDETFPQTNLSTDYPFLHKVELKCSVAQRNWMFFYDYTLINDRTNRGSVQSFQIEISMGTSSLSYDTVGLRFSSKYEREQFEEEYPGRARSVVPVGFPRLPVFWTATLANDPVAWFAIDTLFLNPGESITGITMMSKALPGIRNLFVRPNFNIYDFFPSLEDTTRTMSISQMDSIREAVNFHGWTIGPTAPPEVFMALIWTDTLLSYVHQSHKLGWINNTRDDDCEEDEQAQDGIVRNLEKRLAQTRDLIVKDKIGAAKNRLERFLHKVERLWDRQQGEEKRNKKNPKIIFTSEAYALLKYNGEYLLDHLTEPKETKEDKKGKER